MDSGVPGGIGAVLVGMHMQPKDWEGVKGERVETGQLFQAVQLWSRNKRKAISGGGQEAKKIHFKIIKTST